MWSVCVKDTLTDSDIETSTESVTIRHRGVCFSFLSLSLSFSLSLSLSLSPFVMASIMDKIRDPGYGFGFFNFGRLFHTDDDVKDFWNIVGLVHVDVTDNPKCPKCGFSTSKESRKDNQAGFRYRCNQKRQPNPCRYTWSPLANT